MSILARAVSKVIRTSRFYWRKREAAERNIAFFKPNYIYVDQFDSSSLLIDVGCGHEAEFAIHAIEKFNCRVIGVDPTLKHAPYLAALHERTKGKFTHVPCAVSSTDGTLNFHESITNESGSLLDNHQNVTNDDVRSYDVESVSLSGLLNRVEAKQVNFLKLDLEGAEYELLNSVTHDELMPFDQIFVEFHHHCLPNHSQDETAALASSLRGLGLEAFSLDDHNYLFYWPERVHA